MNKNLKIALAALAALAIAFGVYTYLRGQNNNAPLSQSNGHVLEVSDKQLSDYTSQGFTVVKFYSPACAACAKMAPVFEEAADDFEGNATFVQIDVDKYPAVKDKHNVTSLPTFIYFMSGQEQGRDTGILGESELEDRISNALGISEFNPRYWFKRK